MYGDQFGEFVYLWILGLKGLSAMNSPVLNLPLLLNRSTEDSFKQGYNNYYSLNIR